jgi:hypothetical protein
MQARVFSAAVNGIEAFPVEVEADCGWGDAIIVFNEKLLAVYFPAMAYCHQVNLAFRHIESVDDAIIADPQSEFVRAGQPIMRKVCQSQTHRINPPLDVRLNCRRHPQKIAVEFA